MLCRKFFLKTSDVYLVQNNVLCGFCSILDFFRRIIDDVVFVLLRRPMSDVPEFLYM